MNAHLISLLAVVSLLAGCKDQPIAGEASKDQQPPPPATAENIDAGEKATAAKLKPVKDPVLEEIHAANLKTRQAYNNRRFDDLEKQAAELRAGKALFGNGSWKIAQFYASLECDDDEPESMWQLHDRIHQEWIAAKPASISARVAYADFLTDYAWRARGTEYADKVTDKGWALFGERLATARKILQEARALDEKDPCWWMTALTVALGQGWDAEQYQVLLAEAHAFEPKFWGYETSRAYALLPRWHGEPGDWEAYAMDAAARPNGLGAEAYVRIVARLHGFYENVFRETKASWPKTREGLVEAVGKYPDSLGWLSEAALLATMAEDRTFAKEHFDRLGDRYLPSVWRKPERFAHYRHWAETGQW